MIFFANVQRGLNAIEQQARNLVYRKPEIMRQRKK